MQIVKRNIGMTGDQLRAKALQNAKAFIDNWADGIHYERQEAAQFEKGFLDIFGLDYQNAKLEYKIKNKEGRITFVDLFWPGEILIEMKSSGSKKYLNGEADDQAFNYVNGITRSVDLPKVVMISDFNSIRLFDLRPHITRGVWDKSRPDPIEFSLSDLIKDENFSVLQFLLGREDLFCKAQPEVSRIAAEELGKLYNLMIEKKYKEDDSILFIMRILFCLFAENSHIFKENQFANFILESIDHGMNVCSRLLLLFEVLNTKKEDRPLIPCLWDNTILDPVLLFPYVDGNLFSRVIATPPISNDEAELYIVRNCATMDWSKISPSIFGALFQSIRTKEERRCLGEHYTSEDNIKKVLNPLFLDSLNKDFQTIVNNINGGKEIKLKKLQEKIANIQLLDPACGCGNFLIVAYHELRDIEYRIIKELYNINNSGVQQSFNVSIIRKVKLTQLHGIEIDPFPRMIAMTAAWLQDHLENEKLSILVGEYIPTIPLHDAANIICNNALRLDWESCFEDMKQKEFDFIFGNPPFNGARTMSQNQKDDMKFVFGKLNGIGDLDYVTAWYLKSSNYMAEHSNCCSAYVSTNSITQGEQVPILWRLLFEKIYINFAHRTFKWENEASGKAAVHCVIICIKSNNNKSNNDRIIFKNNNNYEVVDYINPYLSESKIEFIKNRSKPLCNVPIMSMGNQPIDNGLYIFSEQEKDDFIKKESLAAPYFHVFLGSREYLYNIKRYILLASQIPPNLLKKMPKTQQIIREVQEYRKRSKSEPTRNLAETPTKFNYTNIPDMDYIVIPEVSSENRKYIPISILSKDVLVSNLMKIIPSCDLYILGILSSSVHMIWMKAVGGRLEMRYRYSAGIVYNNFPWPRVTRKDARLNNLVSKIIECRGSYMNSTLADLYNPLLMPDDLRELHLKLDKAVLKLYGLKVNANEEDILSLLFALYNEYSQNLKENKSMTK